MRPVLLAALLPLAACGNGSDTAPGITGTGSGSSRAYAVGDFTGVELAGSDDVDIRTGAGFSVHAEGDPEVLDRLRIRKDGNMLRIDRRRSRMLNWSNKRHVKVYVTMPRLTDASLAGSGDMTVDRVEGAAFHAGLAGSGTMTVASLSVQQAKVDIAGSASFKGAGQARALDLSIAGSGDLDAPRLMAARAKVSIAGSGNVRATVDGTADVNIMGSGDVDFGPKAKCNVSKMGSGSVRCG